MLQAALCCSTLQHVAARCSTLHEVALCCSMQHAARVGTYSLHEQGPWAGWAPDSVLAADADRPLDVARTWRHKELHESGEPGWGEPSPSADVAAARPRPGADVDGGERSPGADEGKVGPVPVQLWRVLGDERCYQRFGIVPIPTVEAFVCDLSAHACNAPQGTTYLPTAGTHWRRFRRFGTR